MERGKIPGIYQSKLSGYSWIKIGTLSEDDQIRAAIAVKDVDKDYDPQISSMGFKITTRLRNKIYVVGYAKDIPRLASLDFVDYIEISNPLQLDDSGFKQD